MAKTKHFGPPAAAAGALVAVALLVLMLVVVKPQPAKAAFPGQNGRIAFSSDRDGDYDIYTVSSTGTEVGLFQRTNDPARDQEPAYSPNGNKIAFQSDRSGNWDIWTVNTTGTPNLTQITNNPANDRDPNWSPNGNRITFASSRSGATYNYDILTVSSTGMEMGLDEVTEGNYIERRPAYSPDGNKIVYESGLPPPNDSYVDIETINSTGVPGETVQQITSHPATDEEPAYSPDGSKIAFASNRSGNVEIYTVSSTGWPASSTEVDLLRITNNPALDEKPAFSPDGSRIVFDSDRNATFNNPDNYDIFTISCSFQTPTLTQITNHPKTDYAADWQRLP